MPDIFVIYGGHCFALELKSEGGRVTDAQAIIHERLLRAGAKVAVTFGLDEAIDQLQSWGLLRGA